MKTLRAILGLWLLTLCVCHGQSTRALEFNYPTNWITSNVWFRLYYTPALTAPPQNWQLLTNVSAGDTNFIFGALGTNRVYRVPFTPTQQTIFFGATASNSYHGLESEIVPTTEPLPPGFPLKIK